MLFAQISDMHIRPPGRLAYRRVDTARALERCVAHLNALDPLPQFVLVTGDLVDFGTDAEYGLFGELVSPLRIPSFLVPGNHDQRDALRRAFPDRPELRTGGEFIQYAFDAAPLRLIGLDSTVPGAPWGELCAERLRWLEARLEEANRPTVLFMHHPPFRTGIRHMDVQNCRDGAALGALLERHRHVQALLCGHVHRFICTGWHGVLACICPGPAHAVALDLRPDGPPALSLEPPACLLHQWSDAGLVSQVSFIGAYEGPYPFFDADGRLID